jgi:hypothetical protein
MNNWKECGWKWSWPNLRSYPSIRLDELMNTIKMLSQNYPSLDGDLKPITLELEAEALLTSCTLSLLALHYFHSGYLSQYSGGLRTEWLVAFQVQVTLQLTVRQSGCLGVEPQIFLLV